MSNKIMLSEEEEQRIVELYQSGVSKHKMYKDYKIPYSTAGRVLDKHGIMHQTETRKKIEEMSDEEKALIIKLYQELMPMHKLAKKVGHSSNLCKMVLKENGVALRTANCKYTEKKPKGRKISEIKEGEPIDCDTEGQRCIYRAGVTEKYLCDYCCMNKRSRGGSPHECTKYVFKTGKGKKRKTGEEKENEI